MSSKEEQKEQYRIMIDNDKEFVIDSIIEKNDELTRQDVKIEELEEEIERLNNIIKRLEEDLREMYLTFGEFSEEYTENKIKELKGVDKE